MPPLDSSIDELYQRPLGEFVATRNALARTLKGDAAKKVKALSKPTLVAWVVNQVYWRERAVFQALRKSGEALRAAQVAALKGRSGDVRLATTAHREVVARAVKAAVQLASAAGGHPGPEELSRMLEAVSLARDLPEPPGRFTKALQPAGFEALAGIPIKAKPHEPAPPSASPSKPKPPSSPPLAFRGPSAAERAAQKRRERERAAAERRRAEAVTRAEAALEKARAAEARARQALEHATAVVEQAKRDLADASAG